MGILQEPLDWMAALVKDGGLPKGFSVMELGDQFVTAVSPKYLSNQFYEDLGCGQYASVDGNGMNGSLVYDLNIPFHKQTSKYSMGDIDRLLDQYDLVTDFGTGEHVFDQAAVWRNIHQWTKPGGFIVFDRPNAGYPGHCYYLVQEELIRDIAAANEYHVERLEFRDTTRGRLIRGVLRRDGKSNKFRNPQQGRYKSILKVA